LRKQPHAHLDDAVPTGGFERILVCSDAARNGNGVAGGPSRGGHDVEVGGA
jgi:hypothetical protein